MPICELVTVQQAIETADANPAELLSVRLYPNAVATFTGRIAAVGPGGEARHWEVFFGARHDGNEAVLTTALDVRSDDGTGLAGASLQLRVSGEVVYLDAVGLPSNAVMWGGSLEGDQTYP